MMRNLLVLLGCLMLAAAAVADEPQADLLLRHGAIYTMDAARSWAQAIAIRQGRIVYVGPDAGAPAAARVVDLGGRMVLPGFEDSHVHPVLGGVDLGLCRLDGLKTAAQVCDAVTRYAKAHPERPWIEGAGWDLPLFPHGSPTRAVLDKLVPDRPAYLEAADGHSAWFNTRAMQLAGMSKATPDPVHGRIERDRNGEPSGTLREAAMELIHSHMPMPTIAEGVEGLKRALQLANRCGITSLYEAHAIDPVLETYHTLDASGELTARVVAAMHLDLDAGPAQVAALKEKRDKYQGHYLRPMAAKIFADGVIEAHTAAMLAPYSDRPHDAGYLNIEPAAFDTLVTALDREGFQVHVHAIGDRAVHCALDAFAAARRINGVRDSRHIIAHLEVVDPKDVPRFRELGVVACFQPLWAYRDSYVRDLTEPFLGPERSARLYPMRSVAQTGAVLAGGSDWDVTSINPLEAIQVAVTRRAPEEPAGPPWLPGEMLDLRTALAMYTIDGAWASHQERETGSLEVGKAADLIVLDHNLFAIAPQSIHRTHVLWTLLEGREVYRDAAWRAEMRP